MKRRVKKKSDKESGYSAEDEKKILENLKNLGYV
jgi:hypothetical protein